MSTSGEADNKSHARVRKSEGSELRHAQARHPTGCSKISPKVWNWTDASFPATHQSEATRVSRSVVAPLEWHNGHARQSELRSTFLSLSRGLWYFATPFLSFMCLDARRDLGQHRRQRLASVLPRISQNRVLPTHANGRPTLLDQIGETT